MKGVQNFPKGISLNANVIEFDLFFYDVAVQHFSHEGPTKKCW